MKAWIQEEFGEPSEVLKWKEVPSLVPEKAQLKISVLGAGLNFPDLLCIQGKYQVKPELPFTPGAEGSPTGQFSTGMRPPAMVHELPIVEAVQRLAP